MKKIYVQFSIKYSIIRMFLEIVSTMSVYLYIVNYHLDLVIDLTNKIYEIFNYNISPYHLTLSVFLTIIFFISNDIKKIIMFYFTEAYIVIDENGQNRIVKKINYIIKDEEIKVSLKNIETSVTQNFIQKIIDIETIYIDSETTNVIQKEKGNYFSMRLEDVKNHKEINDTIYKSIK